MIADAEDLESRAYLAKSAAIGLRLAVRGCSLQGDEMQALLEMAEGVEERVACLHELLEKAAPQDGEAPAPAKRGRS
jgi:hypothetical protein